MNTPYDGFFHRMIVTELLFSSVIKVNHNGIFAVKRMKAYVRLRNLPNIREVAESRTADIFIRDTAYFYCDAMNCDS